MGHTTCNLSKMFRSLSVLRTTGSVRMISGATGALAASESAQLSRKEQNEAIARAIEESAATAEELGVAPDFGKAKGKELLGKVLERSREVDWTAMAEGLDAGSREELARF